MKLAQSKQLFAKHNIAKVKLGGFNIDGVLRGKYVSLEKFLAAVESGFGFCDVIFGWDSSDALYHNVTVTGWHTGYPNAGARTGRRGVQQPGTASRTSDGSMLSWARSRRPPSRRSARKSRMEKIRPQKPSAANMTWLAV